MCPSVSVNRKTRRISQERRGAALLLALAAGAFVYGCQKSAADNAPGAGAPALPVPGQVAPAVKIPDTTGDLSILKSRHAGAIKPPGERPVKRIFRKAGDRGKARKPLPQ